MSAPRGPKHAKTMAPTKYLYLVYSGLFIAIFLLDLAIPRGVAVAVLYILPVFISFWDANGKSVYVWTLLAIALIVTGYFLSSPGASTWQSIANRSLSILVVCSSAFLVIKRREVEESRVKALNEVKILRGLLPICASCKKIRDDHGYWNQIETYIRDHSEAEFSHSICPDCMRALYPEYADKVLGG